jgi:hypothetical protein
MSIEINITDNIVEVTPTTQQVDINITENPIEVNVTDEIVLIAQTGLQGPQGPAGPGVAIGGTAGQILAKNSSTNYDTLWINNAVGTVTSVGTSSPLTGGTITSSGTIGITQSSASGDGYLSSTDWSTFNGKVSSNIYTADGTISTALRTVTMGASHILFSGENNSSGAFYKILSTQTSVNTIDTGDLSFQVGYRLLATSTSNQLVTRAFAFGANNSLTGGGAITNFRILDIGVETNSGTTTTNNDIIYILGNALTNGTVTNQRGVLVRSMQGTNRAAFVSEAIGGTTSTYLLIGTQTIPAGTWGVYQSENNFNNYLAGKLVIGTTTVSTFSLDVNGTTRLNGVTTIGTVNAATTDTDRFLVSDSGVIKYRTGSQILSDIGGQGALTLTTTGTSGAATLISNTLNIPNYGSALTGYVPYTGATANVDLGVHTILAQNATIASSGSGNTATITHSSGSGIALNITKGGNGEGLYINKTSGSGNAATIIGTINATTLVKSGGTSSQFLKADGTVDSTAYGLGSVTSVAALTLGTTGTDLSSTVANGTTTPVITLQVPTASATNRGALSSTDWTTFNNKPSVNIYTGDGTLTGNRIVTMGSNTLSFEKDLLIYGLTIGRGSGGLSTNITFGVTALRDNTTGDYNVAIGDLALLKNTTGRNNIAIGSNSQRESATGQSNTSLGSFALYQKEVGDNNVALGVDALSAILTGSENIGIGYQAGKQPTGSLQYAENSIFIGSYTKANSESQTNQIVIGYNATGLGSNTTVLGNSSTTFGRWYGNLLVGGNTNNGVDALQVTGSANITGNLTVDTNTLFVDAANNRVGIGSLIPSAKFEVNVGSSVAYFTRTAGDNGTTAPTFGILTSSTNTRLYNYGDSIAIYTAIVGGTIAERMRITSGGNVGIGTTTPDSYWSQANKLVVGGTGNQGISILSTSSNNSVIAFVDTSTGFPGFDSGGSIIYGHSSDSMQFRINGAERMNITSAGNVGIGTTSPESFGNYKTLEVSATAGGIIFAKSTTGSITTQLIADNGVLGGYVGTRTNHPFSIRTNNTDKINITSGGNVLIGTTTDNGTDKLQVTGSSTFSSTVTAASYTVNDAGNISVGTTTGTKIGTATSQKLSFWNATPIIQPTTSIAESAFVENLGGSIVNVDSTFDGYTIQQIAKALRNAGLLA